MLLSMVLPTTSNLYCTQFDPQSSPVLPGIVGWFEAADYYHCGVYRLTLTVKWDLG